MSEHPNQPSQGDVVLGGQGLNPAGGVVLGGFEGLRQRLLSPIAQQRAAALLEALQHGQKGLNLVMRALDDSAAEVRQAAYQLLEHRPEPKVRRALERYLAREHFAQLRSLLAKQQWKAADQETRVVLLRMFNLGVDRHLRPDQIGEVPCQDLRIIDQLWTRYSRGRFGFSVQRAIWERLDRLLWNKADVWSTFADRVGWRVNHLLKQNYWKTYGEISFRTNAPPGHLPFLGDKFGIFTVEAFCYRLRACQHERAATEATTDVNDPELES